MPMVRFEPVTVEDVLISVHANHYTNDGSQHLNQSRHRVAWPWVQCYAFLEPRKGRKGKEGIRKWDAFCSFSKQ
jgi:hypothetical protein